MNEKLRISSHIVYSSTGAALHIICISIIHTSDDTSSTPQRKLLAPVSYIHTHLLDEVHVLLVCVGGGCWFCCPFYLSSECEQLEYVYGGGGFSCWESVGRWEAPTKRVPKI